MTKEDLSSDRINYLIWRYLQESNYQETASKLQKEWNVEDPQVFEFAAHVKQHALVAVLHRGLLYSETERKSTQVRCEVATQLPGFFGPLAPLSPPPGGDGNEFEKVRKREVDPRQSLILNGSPAKRPRLSNGHENGIEPMPMDIDETPNGNGHAYPSPKEVEQLPTPIIVTEGPERGTQVEKIAELGSETTYLTLSDPENSEVKPLVLFCAWNPRDPTILAGAGTEKLARLWTISRGTAFEGHSHVNGSTTPYQDLVDRNFSARNTDVNSTMTAMSWTSDGAAIALATELGDEYAPSERDTAKVSIWGADGSLIQEYTGFEPTIYCLQWNPSNTALLSLIMEGTTTVITIFSPSSQKTVAYPLPEHPPELQPLEALWTGEQDFLIFGGDLLCAFVWSDRTISQVRKFETREDHRLVKAAYDRHSRLLATANETGTIDIWDHTGQCHSRSAHQGQIISLLWQPMANNMELESNSERLLASSGEDGIISIWGTRPESRPKCSMTMDGAVVALAFTPDGAFLASATTQQILIWKLDDPTTPRARWVPGSDHHWSEGAGGLGSSEEDPHTLSWDANGQKLAYGVNHNLAVIEWRPVTNGMVP